MIIAVTVTQVDVQKVFVIFQPFSFTTCLSRPLFCSPDYVFKKIVIFFLMGSFLLNLVSVRLFAQPRWHFTLQSPFCPNFAGITTNALDSNSAATVRIALSYQKN